MSGYAKRTVGGRYLFVHRLVWEEIYGPIPAGMVIDHIDGDPTNNHISNLRCVTRSINQRNMKKPRDNTSGVMGVSLYIKQNGARYWQSKWVPINGKPKGRMFSCEKYGEFGAYVLATSHRAAMELEHGYIGRRRIDFKVQRGKWFVLHKAEVG